MVALAGWWNTPTFSPIGVLSAFYDGNFLFQMRRIGRDNSWILIGFR